MTLTYAVYIEKHLGLVTALAGAAKKKIKSIIIRTIDI